MKSSKILYIFRTSILQFYPLPNLNLLCIYPNVFVLVFAGGRPQTCLTRKGMFHSDTRVIFFYKVHSLPTVEPDLISIIFSGKGGDNYFDCVSYST